MTIDELKIELIFLQKKDEEDAHLLGIKDKKNYLKYILNKKNDPVAEALFDLSKRYQVSINTLAYYFDPTMIFRINKIINTCN